MAVLDRNLEREHRPLGWIERVPGRYWVVGFILLVMPLFAGDFVLFQIFGWTFILGVIALSLMFLGGYGGMVSLAQMTVAGCAGYMLAIFGDSAITAISLGWPWWLTIRCFSRSTSSSGIGSPDSFSASSQIECVIAAFLAFCRSGTPLLRHSEMTG